MILPWGAPAHRHRKPPPQIGGKRSRLNPGQHRTIEPTATHLKPSLSKGFLMDTDTELDYENGEKTWVFSVDGKMKFEATPGKYLIK